MLYILEPQKKQRSQETGKQTEQKRDQTKGKWIKTRTTTEKISKTKYEHQQERKMIRVEGRKMEDCVECLQLMELLREEWNKVFNIIDRRMDGEISHIHYM
jgi:hypothetical protein